MVTIFSCNQSSHYGKYCSKQFWSYIKSQRNDQTSIPALQVDGRAIDDDLSKAESFNDYFWSVFTQEGNSPLPHLPVTDYPSIDPIEVSTEGVFTLLQSLDPCKACGPDNIPTRFIKETVAKLAPSLTLLYQASINQGRVPNEWKKAKVAPVYKKGGRSLVVGQLSWWKWTLWTKAPIFFYILPRSVAFSF